MSSEEVRVAYLGNVRSAFPSLNIRVDSRTLALGEPCFYHGKWTFH
jgi:hypothetical protein